MIFLNHTKGILIPDIKAMSSQYKCEIIRKFENEM